MQEATTRRVVIPDVDPSIFKQLLHYMYAGKAPDLRLMANDIAQPLLLAADKYDIQDLKDECQMLLRSRITVENAIDTLIWAHYHSVTRLAEAALNFVAQCDQEKCVGQSDLEEMSKTCPEICHLIADKRSMLLNKPSICLC
jgi:speckle-type POZ protein